MRVMNGVGEDRVAKLYVTDTGRKVIESEGFVALLR